MTRLLTGDALGTAFNAYFDGEETWEIIERGRSDGRLSLELCQP